MALIDDYNAAVENPQFRQKVAVAVAKAVAVALDAPTPPAAQLALARRFYLTPEAEINRYVLPVAARIIGGGGQLSNDAHITTAVNLVLVDNVKLEIGAP